MINETIRKDFPVLQKHPGLVYLDNAATSLKPGKVIEAMDAYYTDFTANTGRGSHKLSQEATRRFEDSRKEVAGFIGAKESELVFTRNATESINLAAVSLERSGLFKKGDEILVSFFEHHANIIPWQQLCSRTGMKLRYVKLHGDYTLDMDDLREKVNRNTRVVALAHASNTVASIQPAAEVAKAAHDAGAVFLLDGAQSVPHMEVNVKRTGADFCVFSGHKMLGPTGIGALFAKEEFLDRMPPYNFGGGTIKSVSFEKTVFADGRAKFEAGTVPVAEALGLAEACRYLEKTGMDSVREHDKRLTGRCMDKLMEVPGLEMYCPKDPEKQAGIVAFDVDGLDPVDLGVALDESRNIAIRTGFHCAEPIVRSINPKGLCRASFYVYNTIEEIDTFAGEVMAISSKFT